MKREDVLELRDKWDQAITLSEVMDWLGLSDTSVLKLVQIGLLTAQQKRVKGLRWAFNPSAVAECLDRIMEKVTDYPCENNEIKENLLSLEGMRQLLATEGLDMASILQEVAEGRLPAYHSKSQRPQLRNLLFTCTDIDTFLESMRTKKGWIGAEEVSRMLGIDLDNLSQWIQAGLISPAGYCAKKRYFDENAIKKFIADRVLCAEAAEILGVCAGVPNRLIRQGRLEALRGPIIDGSQHYIFSREYLLQWRKQRVTTNEARRFLGVKAVRRIITWVQQGKLVPIDGASQHPWYFWRQDLLELRNEMHPQIVEKEIR